MRVALVNNTLAPPGRGGAEAVVVALAEHLRHAHEVIVFSGSATQLDGVRCIQLPSLELLPADAHPLRKAVMHARDLWMWSVHTELRRHLAAASVDIVNTHEVQCLSAAAFTAVSSLGLAHVHTTHDPNLLCARIKMDRDGAFCGGRCLACRPQRLIRGRAAGARLDALIAPTESLRDMHVAAGIVSARKAFLIRQGVPPGNPRVRDPKPGRVHVGFIGRLARYKGPLTLLRAVERLPEGWRVSIAGSGPLEEQIIAAARRDPRIEFHGYVTGDAKDAFFERLDLLVVPSEWEEPAPVVAVEAAVRGIPAVVSHRGGLPETPHCKVFRSGDSDSLSHALQSFVASGDAVRASEELLKRREEFLFSRYGRETERVMIEVARGEPVSLADTMSSGRADECP